MNQHVDGTSASTHSTSDREQNISTSGCRKIFLDFGANIGMHARFFFEPDRYPDRYPDVEMDENLSEMKSHVFDRLFGDANEVRRQPHETSGICYFGFEANFRHAARLKKLQACYQRRGLRVQFFAPTAVWHEDTDGMSGAELVVNEVPDRNDWTSFVVPVANGEKVEEDFEGGAMLEDSDTVIKCRDKCGSHIRRSDVDSYQMRMRPARRRATRKSKLKSQSIAHPKPEERKTRMRIATFNFPRFLEEIRERERNEFSRSDSPAKASPSTLVVAKIDIEGGEWRVLHELHKRNLLCQGHGLDVATIEFHRDSWKTGESRNHLNETEEIWKAMYLSRWYMGDPQCFSVGVGSRSGPTELIKLDTEAYVNDGVPLDEEACGAGWREL